MTLEQICASDLGVCPTEGARKNQYRVIQSHIESHRVKQSRIESHRVKQRIVALSYLLSSAVCSMMKSSCFCVGMSLFKVSLLLKTFQWFQAGNSSLCVAFGVNKPNLEKYEIIFADQVFQCYLTAGPSWPASTSPQLSTSREGGSIMSSVTIAFGMSESL